jgi:drug/metabolite transporter (DMT)-like permease
VVAGAFGYSVFPVFTKQALDEGLRPTDLLVWRFVIAVPVAWSLLFVRTKRGGPSWQSAPRRLMAALGLLFGVMALLAFAGLEHLPASLFTVIIYTYPAMVALGSWLLGRPVPRALWGALVVTMFGIALTVPEVFAGTGGADPLGMWLTLLNAACYAVYLLVSGSASARAGRGEGPFDPIVASTWSMTGSLVFALTVGAMVGVRGPSSFAGAAGIVGLALVSTIAAGWTIMIGVGRLGPARAALISTIEPVLTLTWAVILLGETLQVLQLVGAALVIAGVVWTQAAPVGAIASRSGSRVTSLGRSEPDEVISSRG